ncbi:oxamate carbamoyltransferase subunit AllH family protein [Microbacterium sp. MAHUQ-60]|uniref:oxamate carbamoyltransferase subunit AllH family protein n=1 Tax=unclassified Microbacterium TaxID=2609290 RepID=UPI0036200C9C
MTPVAPPVALRATTWDAALEETLSSSAHAGMLGDLSVHSVHDRVINLRCGDGLIALVDDRLDDAPFTIRIRSAQWPLLPARVGDPARITVDGLIVHAARTDVRVVLHPADRWIPAPIQGAPSVAALRDARAALAAMTPPPPMTPFGLASAPALAAGIDRMRIAASAVLQGSPAENAVTDAARRLIGLGEGLTPSGDDILTGLAFIAAHPGFGLTRLIAPLSDAVCAGFDATTLLSTVTVQAALAGRARARLHDLVAAVVDGSSERILTAAVATAAIGHTSGHDILTGIRLALDLAGTRAPAHAL